MVKSKFTPQEKSRIVLESLNTNIATAELCRKYNIHPQTFYSWKEKFVDGGKAALVSRTDNNISKALQKENETLKRIVGELTIVNDTFKKTLEGHKR